MVWLASRLHCVYILRAGVAYPDMASETILEATPACSGAHSMIGPAFTFVRPWNGTIPDPKMEKGFRVWTLEIIVSQSSMSGESVGRITAHWRHMCQSAEEWLPQTPGLHLHNFLLILWKYLLCNPLPNEVYIAMVTTNYKHLVNDFWSNFLHMRTTRECPLHPLFTPYVHEKQQPFKAHVPFFNMSPYLEPSSLDWFVVFFLLIISKTL